MKTIRYKYRLYPNHTQEQILKQMCGNVRFVWNYFLNREIEQYKIDQTFNFTTKNSKHLTDIKPDFPFLDLGLRDSYTQTLKDLSLALTNAGKKAKHRRGFPRFKKKKFNIGSFTASTGSGLKTRHINYEQNRIQLPKMGQVRIKWSRQLPSEIKTWTIKQTNGKWFISFVVAVHQQPPVTEIKSAIGVDLNSNDLFVTSDAEVISNPKYLKKAKQILVRKQRSLSRKKKRSNNYYKQLPRLQRAHERVAEQRKDFLHKATSQLIDSNDAICLEDLNVHAMQRWNGHMTGDAGFGVIRTMIDYKCELYGKHLIVIDRYAPSTQMCSACGHVKSSGEKLSLDQRHYHCDACGHAMLRDLNAAVNILQIGMGSAKYTPVELHGNGVVCPHGTTNPVTSNQECTVGVPTLSSHERSE